MKVKENLNSYVEHTIQDVMKLYSKNEYESFSEEDRYEIVFDAACCYVDGDDAEFDEKVSLIAEEAFERIEKPTDVLSESFVLLKEAFERKSSLKEMGGYETFKNHIGELDSFYNPYKNTPSLSELDKEAMESINNYSDDNYVEKFRKTLYDGINFRTGLGLEKAAERWASYEFSDFIHDIAHDGEKGTANALQGVLNGFFKEITKAIEDYDMKPEEVHDGELRKIINMCQKRKAAKARSEKAAATKEANKDKRAEKYADELLNYDLPEELASLFNENGFYKERKSWGVIKDYFNQPYGKALKNLWVNQFS